MQLYLQDTAVALDPSASLSLNFVCPAFDADSVARGYSLPFRVPHTPKSLALLKHKNRLDTRDNGDTIPATITRNNEMLSTGVYKILKSGNGLFDGHFENESRVNLASLSQLKIVNLLPVIPIPQTTLPVIVLQIRPPNLATGYEITIDDHEFRPDGTTQNQVGSSLANSINQHFGENIATWNATTFLVSVQVPADRRSLKVQHLTPYFNGVTITSASATIPGAQQDNFVNFVRSSLFTPRTDVSFALMANSKLYEGKNATWSGLINFAEYDTVAQFWRIVKSPPSVLATDWTYTFVPFFRVAYILQKIADALKVSVVASDIPEWAEFMTLLVYNSHSLDDVKQAYEFAELKYTNAHAVEIDPKNHLPNVSVSDFLNQFCDVANLYWLVENEKLVFKEKDILLRGDATDDFTPFLIKDTDERGYKTYDGFTIAFSTEDNDSATSDLIKPYTEGNGGERITLKVGTLPEKMVHGLKETCFSNQVRQTSPNLLRFMFDRGVQVESTDIHYLPTASAARYGTVSLSPSYLFSRFWRESAYYRAAGWSFEANFQLPSAQLFRALRFDNVLRRVETRRGARIAAIWKIQITEKVTGATDVKIEFKVK